MNRRQILAGATTAALFTGACATSGVAPTPDRNCGKPGIGGTGGSAGGSPCADTLAVAINRHKSRMICRISALHVGVTVR